jgi:hypothetical protein
MNIPCFNTFRATGTPVSAARAGWIHVALFVAGETAALSPVCCPARERIKIYDFPHSLYPSGSQLCLLDFRMVFLARVSGLQPVFKNPQS